MDSSGAIPQSLVESITYQNKGLYSFAYGDRLPPINRKLDDEAEETLKDEESAIGNTFILGTTSMRKEEQLGARTYRISDRDGKMYAFKIQSLARSGDGPYMGVSLFFLKYYLGFSFNLFSVTLKFLFRC